MSTQSKFNWQRAPIPWDQFPAGSGGGLRLGQPWTWFVAGSRASRERTLFASDPAKEEFRIWQCRTDQDSTVLMLRIEHHGARPGWHIHAPTDEVSAYLGQRQAVSSAEFPAIAAASLWREPVPESHAPPFPAERMTEDMVAELCALLAAPFEDITLRPVPFGLAIGLTERQVLGDSLAIYVSQLGRDTPVFRLEDDGTTIPALQASGALASADYMLPHDILGPHTKGLAHFSPDMRTLFTPYFTADELAGRVADFAQALSTFGAILNAHETGRTGHTRATQRPPRRETGDSTATVDTPADPHRRGGSPLPNGNAWTRAASYVTV